MSTELEPLAQSIIAQPAALEHRLVVAMQGVARRIVEKPEVVQALVAADALPAGLVIADEAKAAEVVDLMRTVIAGEKLLALEEGLALRIPRRMEQAVKDFTAEARGRLKAAKEVGNGARVAYQSELRRRAANEEAERRRQADAAARKAAEEAAPFGEDAPPVAEVAPVVVPRTIAGGAGKSHTQVRTAAVEIVDLMLVPPAWLALVPTVAKAEFDLAVLKREVEKPQPGESVVWKGVRFEARESAVNR